MKIVVTGAAGFIGSHTCERLVARGHDVIGVDVFDDYLYPAGPKRRNAEALVATLDSARFALIESDICDRDRMHEIIDSSVDVVCHLAALAGVRPSLREPLRYIRTNLHGTTVLLEACRENGVDRMAFASSSSVYGSKAREGQDLGSIAAFREDDPCLTPASPYAATKRSGELLGSTYRDLYGVGVSCLRFFTVYGPRQRPDMAIHKFVKAIAAGEPITLFGDGSSRRDYTYIDDIVTGVVATCEKLSPGSFKIYNLGGTATTSLAELVSIIEETLQKNAVIRRLPMQPGDVPITFADIRVAREELGYQPETSVQDGVREFWSWYQSQGA